MFIRSQVQYLLLIRGSQVKVHWGMQSFMEVNTLVTQNPRKKQQNTCNLVTVKVSVTILVLLFNSHL